jgi:hypothetical protein
MSSKMRTNFKKSASMDNAHKNTDKNPTQNPLLYFNTATIMGRRIRDMVVAVWETTACQLAKGEWKFRVASNIHFILAGLAIRNLKTFATITGLQL